MMRCLHIVLVLLFWTATVVAQEPFKVLAVRGSVTVSGRGLGVGQRLKMSDKITVAKGGYLALVHTNGRTVEVRKDGSVRVQDLDAAATKKSGTATSKFASYVVDELTNVDEPASFKDKRRSNMRTTGSVERAAGDEVDAVDSLLAWVGGPGELRGLAITEQKDLASGNGMHAIMPRTTRLLNDTVQFSWHKAGGVSQYTLRIVNTSDAVVFSKTTADTTITLVMSKVGVEAGKVCYWDVANAADADMRSTQYAFLLLSGTEQIETQKVVSQVVNELDDPQSVLSMLILANLYEDLGLNYDAFRAYTDAIEREPTVKTYRRIFSTFLLRQNCNLDAFAVYNAP